MSMWDDEAGYDYDDPKHPTWSDRMLDMADSLRKISKEQGLSETLVREDEALD